MKDYIEFIQGLQPALKIIAFFCLFFWGILKAIREMIAAGAEFMHLLDKLKLARNKHKNHEKGNSNSPN